MRPLHLLIAAALVIPQVTAAQMKYPSYEEVSRCFFIYAAIFEVGRDHNKPQLFQFGQTRSSWAGGYVQANQNNQAFKRVFENNLAANKRTAIQILDSLPTAIANRNQSAFNAIINQAVVCDRSFGIRTSGLPAME